MNKRYIPSLAGIAAGILAVILSIVLFASTGAISLNFSDTPSSSVGGMDTGTRTAYSYYGGDAYTGIQQAAADTARNVKLQSEILISGFRGLPSIISGSMPSSMRTSMTGYAMILLCMGLGMICYFANKLFEVRAKDSFEDRLLETIKGLIPAEEDDDEDDEDDDDEEEIPAEETETVIE